MHAQRTRTPDLLDVFDVTGRRRSPATHPDFARGRPPRNKGRTYPPKSPGVEEIVTFLRAIPDTPAGRRLQALTITGWRSGLRVAELCDLEETDLDRRNYSITVRAGKGGKRRVSAMDGWAWQQLEPWLAERRQHPVGALFPVLVGPTAGRPMATTTVRAAFRQTVARSGLRLRLHPHSLRHAHAVELWREGVDILTICRQLGHANVAITMAYLQSLDPLELLEPIGKRKPPTMPLPQLARAI